MLERGDKVGVVIERRRNRESREGADGGGKEEKYMEIRDDQKGWGKS